MEENEETDGVHQCEECKNPRTGNTNIQGRGQIMSKLKQRESKFPSPSSPCSIWTLNGLDVLT